ncbi:MAG: hypothetical protein KDH94_02470, partial [Coxiellaceae bacterium]|nr:hypothetical protein [Coxiellaceae bacterium]
MRSGFPVQFTLKNVFPVPSAYEKMAENISRISHASILTIPVIFDDSGSAQYQGGLSLQQNSHLQQKAKRRLYVLTNDRPGNKVVTNDLQREPDDSTTEKNNISLAEGMVAKLGALGIAAELKVQDTGVGTVFQSDRAAMPAYSIVIKMGEATQKKKKKLASVAPA